MDLILYIDDYPVKMFCDDRDASSFLKETHSASGVDLLTQLMEQKVLLHDEVPDMLQSLQELQGSSQLRKFGWIADELKDAVENTEVDRCIYLRRKELNLRDFLEEKAFAWERLYQQNPEDEDSLAAVVKTFFDELDYHGFDIDDDSCSSTVVEVLWTEVFDYWGGICWNQAELNLNNIEECPRDHRKDMDFRDLVEMIYWTCKEYS